MHVRALLAPSASTAAHARQMTKAPIMVINHANRQHSDTCGDDWAQALAVQPPISATPHTRPDSALEHAVAHDVDAAAPTPHPSCASAAEAVAWEAALADADARAASAAGAVHAVIEIGSHCTRLLLATRKRELARISEDTQLGYGSWGPTLAALCRFQLLLKEQDSLAGVAAFGTAALREAPAAQQSAAADALGLPVCTLSGPPTDSPTAAALTSCRVLILAICGIRLTQIVLLLAHLPYGRAHTHTDTHQKTYTNTHLQVSARHN